MHRRHKGREAALSLLLALPFLLPLLLSLAIVVAAPGISGTPRYAYPILYSLPVVMSWYYFLIRKRKNN